MTLTPRAKICMAMSWTTMEQKAGGGDTEERRPGAEREFTGEPPSTADMLADKSPKIRDFVSKTFNKLCIGRCIFNKILILGKLLLTTVMA